MAVSLPDNEFGNRANIVRLDNIRMSPRKLRVVIDQIRGKDVAEALTLLNYSDRGAARPLARLLESGVANIANCIDSWDLDDLIVHRAFVDEGPTMRRFRPRAQGRATRINKRTSRVTIVLRPDEDEVREPAKDNTQAEA